MHCGISSGQEPCRTKSRLDIPGMDDITAVPRLSQMPDLSVKKDGPGECLKGGAPNRVSLTAVKGGDAPHFCVCVCVPGKYLDS